MSRRPRAAVDVGTNSVRLLVVDGDGRRRCRELTITRLGAGVDRTGHLDDAALERTLEAIAAYRRRWESLGVDGAVRIAATSAVRDAADRDRFFTGVRRVAGIDAEVLTGDEEAALAYAGVVAGVDVPAPVAVVDVGGGSTEIIVGDPEGRVAASTSLQLGCVRITERCLVDDPPSDAQLAAAEAEIEARLAEADAALAAAPLTTAATLVAVAGTATTLAALDRDLAAYDEDAVHGAWVSAASLDALTRRLVRLRASERAELGPVQPGREDVIHGGALVLRAVLRRAGAPGLVVSEADNLDGLAASIGS